MGALDPDTSARIVQFLERPPSTDQYKAIREHLIKTFELSQDERADRLLEITELCDRRPSELTEELDPSLERSAPGALRSSPHLHAALQVCPPR